jgi:drug/metabolite transporter (DMT)-like permease
MATLWIVATVIASAAQTARNAMQQSLTATIGTIGATQVRFLYGFPFALMFLFGTSFVTGSAIPPINAMTFAFGVSGAIMQIIGTILMLMAMRLRSFSVATAYLKTEPVLVAIAGVPVLGEYLDLYAWLAIVVATLGVIVLTWKPQAKNSDATDASTDGSTDSGAMWKPALFGVGAGGCFALAAVLFRGGILWLDTAPFYLMASTMLAWSLGIQSLILMVAMLLFDRPALVKSIKAWRQSLFAGFMGAFASQFWFIGFSLTSAANVRTLALVEVVMAQGVSRLLFKQKTSLREGIGMALVVGGVACLLYLHH